MNLLFQYCQKLIVLTPDLQQVLLAKRKGEMDYNSTYSFIGGKLEKNDSSLLDGMRREKDEEIGSAVTLRVMPNESYNVMFHKKDGNIMILPHIPSIYIGGEIHINDEYSEYRWIPISEINNFEPKIKNVPELTRWAVGRMQQSSSQLVSI